MILRRAKGIVIGIVRRITFKHWNLKAFQQSSILTQEANKESFSKSKITFFKIGVGNNLGFKKLSSSALLEATASLKRTAD